MFISLSENRILETGANRSVGIASRMPGHDVLGILPTGFGKSLMCQVFCLAKLSANPNASVLVISPLNSIVEEVAEWTEPGLSTVNLKEKDVQCMTAISQWKFHVIFLFCGAMSVRRISKFVKSELFSQNKPSSMTKSARRHFSTPVHFTFKISVKTFEVAPTNAAKIVTRLLFHRSFFQGFFGGFAIT